MFTHLHCHSDASTLDGLMTVENYCKFASQFHMNAFAITDHGNIYAWVKAFTEAKKYNIKFIPGIEIYLPTCDLDNKKSHLTILAKNQIGYNNIIRLVSLAGNKEQKSDKKVITEEELFSYHDGLIVLSGCLSSLLSKYILYERLDLATELIERFQMQFQNRFYIEIQPNSTEQQKYINPILVDIASKYGLPLVATNDVHYPSKEYEKAHEVLLCAQSHNFMNNPERWRFASNEFYFSTEKEIKDWFKNTHNLSDQTISEAINNTQEITNQCSAIFPIPNQYILPVNISNADNELLKQINKGIKYRQINKKSDELREIYLKRIQKEYATITNEKLSQYFLIVADLINWAKSQMFVGPGRGCLAPETKITLENGQSKQIQNISVGDTIIDATGNSTNVEKTFCYSIQEPLLYFSCFYGDNSVGVTHDHLVLAEQAIKQSIKEQKKGYVWEKPKGILSWIKARNLSIGDWVFVPHLHTKNISPKHIDLSIYSKQTDIIENNYITCVEYNTDARKFSIRDVSKKTHVSRNSIKFILSEQIPRIKSPRHERAKQQILTYIQPTFSSLHDWTLWLNNSKFTRRAIPRFVICDDRFYYILGLWTANGWMQRNRRGVGIAIRENKQDEINNVVSFFKQLGVRPTTRTDRGCVQIVIYHRLLVSLFKDLYRDYCYTAQSKHVPELILNNNNKNILLFLKGYLSGDGHCEKSKIVATTVSSVLLSNLRTLLLKCNIPSSIRTEAPRKTGFKKNYKTLPSFYLTMPHVPELSNIKTEFPKQYRWYRIQNGILLQIRKIKQVDNIQNVYDLQVSSPHHSFLTTSFAVHNSSSGSLICYLLNITDVDPIQHNTLFERFYAPGRVDLPDIDMDFPSSKRQQVIEYLQQKYGKECVSSIITFITFKGKLALRDVARLYSVPLKEINRVVPTVESRLKGAARTFHAIEDAELDNEQMSKFVTKYPEVVDVARKLEGTIRQVGKHAAGVVITDKPCIEYFATTTEDGMLRSCWDKDDLAILKLLKIDILGLDILDVFEQTEKLIQIHNPTFHIRDIPIDDTKVFNEYSNGNTVGVFQFESSGIVGWTKKIGVTKFNDIVDINALYRPGTLGSGLIDLYYEQKTTQQKKNIWIFQEDVMQLCRDMAGFSWQESDEIRKIIAKSKGAEELSKHRQKFVEGCIKNGVPSQEAEATFNGFEYCGAYLFNRAHAVAYSLISYWSMWLKCYYPLEYLCCLLDIEHDMNRALLLFKEAKRLHIDLLPPDLTKGKLHYHIEDNKIRCGLRHIQNVGTNAIVELEKHIPIMSWQDLLKNINKRAVNVRKIISLIQIGATQNFTEHLTRKSLLDNDNAGIKLLLKHIKKEEKLLNTIEQLQQCDEYSDYNLVRIRTKACPLPMGEHLASFHIRNLKAKLTENNIILRNIIKKSQLQQYMTVERFLQNQEQIQEAMVLGIITCVKFVTMNRNIKGHNKTIKTISFILDSEEQSLLCFVKNKALELSIREYEGRAAFAHVSTVSYSKKLFVDCFKFVDHDPE